MSANPAYDPSTVSTERPSSEEGAKSSLRVVSEEVAATRAEIQQLASEIARLAEADLPPSEFFSEFLI